MAKKKEKTLSVDAKTGQRSGTSTYRAPASEVKQSTPAANPFGLERAKGTSSATYGQVSPSGQIEVAPYGGGTPVESYGTPQQIQAQRQGQSQQQAPPPSAFKGQSQPNPNQQGFSQANSPTPGPLAGQDSQSNNVTVQDKKGNNVTYQVDPSKSFYSQTGVYQYDFWTPEGQAERIAEAADAMMRGLNPLDSNNFKANTGSKAADATLELVANNPHIAALAAAGIYQAAAPLLSAMANFNKIGSIALTSQGAKDLAASLPAARAALPAATKAGQAALNTRSAQLAIQGATKAAFANGVGKMGLGMSLKAAGITTLGAIGFIGTGISQGKSTKGEMLKFIEEGSQLRDDLYKIGLSEQAEEIDAQMRDAEKAFESILPYVVIIGNPGVADKISDYQLNLIKKNRAYQEKVAANLEEQKRQAEEQARAEKAEAERIAAVEKLAAEDKAMRDKEEQRRYNEQREEEQRRYNEAREREQRSYNERQERQDREFDLQREAERLQREQDEEDTALTSQGGSTLGFGLLGTGDSPEFVDRDKASQVYFGKVYKELTPEQKALLNLLKQKG